MHGETVWLSANQMAVLFGRDEKIEIVTAGEQKKHWKSIMFKNELKFANMSVMV